MTTSDEGVTLAAVSENYDSIAKLCIQLKTIPCIDNAFVTDINEEENEEDASKKTYTFNVKANFVSMVEEKNIGVEEDTEAASETEVTAE